MTGVSFDDLYRAGWYDTVGRELAMAADEINGVLVLGDTNTSRDFWLAEHADRIMDTVSGFAFTGLTATIPDASCFNAKNSATPQFYKRETYQGTIDRAKEIGERFVHYVVNVQPFTLEYYDGMPEADLRRWAAGVVSALKD